MVNTSTFIIKNPDSNKCLDNTGRVANGRFYHLWTCSTGNKNQWFSLGTPQAAPVPVPIPAPVAPVITIPAPTPVPVIGGVYQIAYFTATPGAIDVETLRN